MLCHPRSGRGSGKRGGLARSSPLDLQQRIPQRQGGLAMLRVDLGSTSRYCDGLSRRSFLQLGVAGMASLGLPQLLRAKEQSAANGGSKKNTTVILLWLDGGPSHMD